MVNVASAPLRQQGQKGLRRSLGTYMYCTGPDLENPLVSSCPRKHATLSHAASHRASSPTNAQKSLQRQIATLAQVWPMYLRNWLLTCGPLSNLPSWRRPPSSQEDEEHDPICSLEKFSSAGQLSWLRWGIAELSVRGTSLIHSKNSD